MMQSKNPFFNDFSKLLTGAFGVAQNARTEIETALSSMLERWLSERDLVTREEFDAVSVLARNAHEKNIELEEKIIELQKQIKARTPGSNKKPAVKKQ
jgi:BMFP domain-containing protein YqiC